ncbi:MAG: CBO0543 family protein [Tumebacillaceae bacterium]
MYFVILFVLSWTAFFCFADRSRFREFYGAIMFTAYLGLLTDVIMVHYQLWEYIGLPHPLYVIPLSLDFGIYPVVCMIFLQWLPQNWGRIFRRSIYCSIAAILLEWLTIRTGHMKHHMWWNLGWSFLSDILIFMMISWVFRYYSGYYGAPVNKIKH